MTEKEAAIRHLLALEGMHLSLCEIADKTNAPIREVMDTLEKIRLEGWAEDE